MIDFFAEIPTWARAVVPTLTAVVGLGTAVTTLTRGTRLRKRAEMLRAEIEAASRPHDKEVLQSLHRDVTADIVALLAVPASMRISALAVYFGALALALITGLLWGFWILATEGYIDLGTLSLPGFGFFALLLAALSLLGLVNGSSEWLKTGLERIRVADAYRRGIDVDRKLLKARGLFPKAEELEGARDSEQVTGRGMRWVLKVQVFLLSFFPWLLLVSSGAAFIIDWNWLALLQILLSVAYLIFLVLRRSVKHARAGLSWSPVPDEWVHPRPLSPAEQIRAEIETAQRPGSPNSRRGLRRLFRQRR